MSLVINKIQIVLAIIFVVSIFDTSYAQTEQDFIVPELDYSTTDEFELGQYESSTVMQDVDKEASILDEEIASWLESRISSETEEVDFLTPQVDENISNEVSYKKEPAVSTWLRFIWDKVTGFFVGLSKASGCVENSHSACNQKKRLEETMKRKYEKVDDLKEKMKSAVEEWNSETTMVVSQTGEQVYSSSISNFLKRNGLAAGVSPFVNPYSKSGASRILAEMRNYILAHGPTMDERILLKVVTIACETGVMDHGTYKIKNGKIYYKINPVPLCGVPLNSTEGRQIQNQLLNEYFPRMNQVAKLAKSLAKPRIYSLREKSEVNNSARVNIPGISN